MRPEGARLDSLQTLCSGLAHELRNPLNAARLQIELAERRARRAPDHARIGEPLELARHELDRLTKLLDEFLAFANPRILDIHAHDVGQLVDIEIEAARPYAARCGVELAFTNAAIEPVTAEVDAVVLREIVANLVANAIEAVATGGRIAASLTATDDDFEITIGDNGPGIPVEILPRMFEPFFSTKPGGTGMGLAIVHGLLASHAGEIEVSTSARGTRMRVCVSRARR